MTTLMRRASLPDLLWSAWPLESLETVTEGHRAMRIEEFLDGDTLVVRAELPGMDPEKDIEITVSDGVLTISAERLEEIAEDDKEQAGYRSEFRYGSFRRSVALPAGTSPDVVAAKYDHGVLEVRVPVATTPPAPAKVAITTT
jgi:HSP20 family protein